MEGAVWPEQNATASALLDTQNAAAEKASIVLRRKVWESSAPTGALPAATSVSGNGERKCEIRFACTWMVLGKLYARVLLYSQLLPKQTTGPLLH